MIAFTLKTQTDIRSQMKQKFSEWKLRLAAAWVVLSAIAIGSMPSSAQSVSISLSPSDLDNFFTWFNTMFQAILPIALIGAGLVAGAAFAFVVGNMLKKAFQSLTGGSV